MKNKDYIFNRIKASIKSTSPTAELILYGSYAREQEVDNSDIDILILLEKDKLTWQEEKQITYPIYDIEFETGTIISLLVLSKKEWESKHYITPFYASVLREGIKL